MPDHRLPSACKSTKDAESLAVWGSMCIPQGCSPCGRVPLVCASIGQSSLMVVLEPHDQPEDRARGSQQPTASRQVAHLSRMRESRGNVVLPQPASKQGWLAGRTVDTAPETGGHGNRAGVVACSEVVRAQQRGSIWPTPLEMSAATATVAALRLPCCQPPARRAAPASGESGIGKYYPAHSYALRSASHEKHLHSRARPIRSNQQCLRCALLAMVTPPLSVRHPCRSAVDVDTSNTPRSMTLLPSTIGLVAAKHPETDGCRDAGNFGHLNTGRGKSLDMLLDADMGV
ncbi:hypothetical protein ACCO45_000884 [Purpureocillium lilacinum]|uniref:Uncharacterized protein n=1 Tax=Purpureocillium lilacinum TaxID=33203 RepID=A0ACC4E5G3_PURLI